MTINKKNQQRKATKLNKQQSGRNQGRTFHGCNPFQYYPREHCRIVTERNKDDDKWYLVQ